MERWRSAVGYEGRYEISDQGRVKSLLSNKIIYVYIHPLGYVMVRLHRNDGGRTRYVHRLVSAAFFGPCPDGAEVNHKNLDKSDNRVGNLEYVSSSTNKQHAVKQGIKYGRVQRGQHNGNSKLTANAVLEIRRRYAQGETQTALAQIFPVSRGMIGHIVNGRNWTHV